MAMLWRFPPGRIAAVGLRRSAQESTRSRSSIRRPARTRSSSSAPISPIPRATSATSLQKQELEKLQADVDHAHRHHGQAQGGIRRLAEAARRLPGNRRFRPGRYLQEHEAGCGGERAWTQVKVTMCSRDHHEALAAPVEPHPRGNGSAKAAIVTNIIASASDPNTSKSKDSLMNMRLTATMRGRRLLFLAGCSVASAQGNRQGAGHEPDRQRPAICADPANVGPIQAAAPGSAQGYSLWNDRQAALFKDPRVLNRRRHPRPVNIQINDKANWDNETNRNRTNKSNMNWDASANRSSAAKPSTTGNATSGLNTSTDAKGKMQRPSRLRCSSLPSSPAFSRTETSLISGSQEVRMNQEIRILNVAGIVRPQDVVRRTRSPMTRSPRRASPTAAAAAGRKYSSRREVSRRSICCRRSDGHGQRRAYC